MKKSVKMTKIKVVQYGNSLHFRIPADFVKHGEIDITKLYELEVKEVENDSE